MNKKSVITKNHVFLALLSRDGAVCGICGGSLAESVVQYLDWYQNHKLYKRTRIDLTIDHIIPYSKMKGTSKYGNLNNLQLAHKKCNFDKSDSMI